MSKLAKRKQMITIMKNMNHAEHASKSVSIIKWINR